jgi:ligand-binding sensor domain-containing protein
MAVLTRPCSRGWFVVALVMCAAILFALPLAARSLSASSSVAQAHAPAPPWTHFDRSQGLASDSVLATYVDSKGYWWIGTNGGLSIRAPDGSWITAPQYFDMFSAITYTIVPDPANPQRHWIGNHTGAILIEPGDDPQDLAAATTIAYTRDDFLPHIPEELVPERPINTSVGSLAVDPTGRIWFGFTDVAFTFGVLVLDPGPNLFAKADDTWISYSSVTDNLTPNATSGITVDARGTVWVSTIDGLNAFSGTTYTAYAVPPGLFAPPDPDAADPDETSPASLYGVFAFGDQIWLSSNGGVAMLTGATTPHNQADDTWTVFTAANSGLALNQTKSLAQDAQGRIWIGTLEVKLVEEGRQTITETGSGINILDLAGTPQVRSDDIWITLNATHGLVSNAVREVAPYGDTWFFATPQGFNTFTPGADLADRAADQWVTYTAAPRLSGFNVQALAFSNTGQTWLGTNGGLSLLDDQRTLTQRGDDQWVTYSTANAMPSNNIRALAADAQGRLWIGTSAGLHVRDLRSTPADPQDDRQITYTTPQLTSAQINAIVIDAQGRAWIATGDYFRGALHVLDLGASLTDRSDDQFASYTVADGLPNAYVQSLALVGETAIWVATDGGAARITFGNAPFDPRAAQITSFTSSTSGLPRNFVRAVLHDHVGNTWFALAVQGVSVYTAAGDWVHFRQEDGLISNSARTLHEDALGRIWIGTSGGISRLDPGASITAKDDDQWLTVGADLLPYDSVQALAINQSGQLWAGTFGGASVTQAIIRTHLPMLREGSAQP